MTVSISAASVTLQGNGSLTVFNYSFEIPFQADGVTPAVSVFLTDTSGMVYPLINGVGYSIQGTGDPAGGTVTYPLPISPPTPALPSGWTITIARALNYTQSSAFPNSGLYPPDIETGLDNQQLQMQQLLAQVASAIKCSLGETIPALPPAAFRIGAYLGFGAEGQVVLIPTSGGIPIPPFIQNGGTISGAVEIASGSSTPLTAVSTATYDLSLQNSGSQGGILLERLDYVPGYGTAMPMKEFVWQALNSSAVKKYYAVLNGIATVTTAGSETGAVDISALVPGQQLANGTLTGGTGYAANDTVTLVPADGASVGNIAATVHILTVSGGVPQTYVLFDNGLFETGNLPTHFTTTGGSGSGLTFTSPVYAGNQPIPFLSIQGTVIGGISQGYVNIAGGSTLYLEGNPMADWTGSLYTATSTVANLPASPRTGQRFFVTDSNTNTFNATVAGGGSYHVPVVFDGTNWTVG